jgi:predicted DNA binding CopG/RHH family protein
MATLIKKPVLVVIDREILSMAKKTARKNGLNFSCFVQSLIENEVLNSKRGAQNEI